jgi:hypothetical protein
MDLKAGTRLASTVCTTEVIVVRPPTDKIDLRCGGSPMASPGSAAGDSGIDLAHRGGTRLGKRYADPGTGLEVLCTKPGDGSLSIGDDAIPIKDAKPLPASD